MLVPCYAMVSVCNGSSKCQLNVTTRITNAPNDSDVIKLTNSSPQKRQLGMGGSKSPIQIHYLFF